MLFSRTGIVVSVDSKLYSVDMKEAFKGSAGNAIFIWLSLTNLIVWILLKKQESKYEVDDDKQVVRSSGYTLDICIREITNFDCK